MGNREDILDAGANSGWPVPLVCHGGTDVKVVSRFGNVLLMFSHLGLFHSVACPLPAPCPRPVCLFAHGNDIRAPPLCVPDAPASAKRPDPPAAATPEPPRKLQKLTPLHNPLPARVSPAQPAVPPKSGAPVLRVIPAQSIVPIPVRQVLIPAPFFTFFFSFVPRLC